MLKELVRLDVPADEYHVMQTHIRGETYGFLVWPKNLPLQYLSHLRAAVNWQLDIFIDSARRETESEEAARLEVESWTAAMQTKADAP